MKRIFTLLITALLFYSCTTIRESGLKKSDLNKDIELITTEGAIVLRLYDDTPISRNNFLKLGKEGMYDSILFHRVIENFMIQAGESLDSKKLDERRKSKNINNIVPAEILPNHFHKRGALGAARMGDDVNPARDGSYIQFYIVHGKTYTDSALDSAEKRVNKMIAYNRVINDPRHKEKHKALQDLRKTRDSKDVSEIDQLKNELDSLTNLELAQMSYYKYPEANREVYKTIGGAAHLDQNYTVFGEVISGMDVVDKIAATQTGKGDRPVENIFILSTRLVKREKQK